MPDWSVSEPSDTLPPPENLDLAELWAGVLAGTHYLLEGYYSEERCFLTVELQKEPPRRRQRLRMAVLERILLGESYKQVAYELGLAVSTVAVACGDCLRAIGNLHLPSRVPALLLMAVQAAHGVPLEPARMYRFQSDDGKEHWIITAERPDRTLPNDITRAEASVLRLLVEGNTQEQMAVLRSASRRTIANQLASAFRKMGLSGRTALLARLIRRGAGVTRSPRVEANLSVARPLPTCSSGRTLST